MRSSIVLAAIAALGVSYADAATAQGTVLYDDFRAASIDPSKWHSGAICGYSGSLDCVREIRGRGLRLGLRTYGDTTSNEGLRSDNSVLEFNNPDTITELSAAVRVDAVDTVGCTENPERSFVQTLLAGTFFNSGSGSSANDVEAFIEIEHDSFDLTTDELLVVAFLFHDGVFFGGVVLGSTVVGERVTLSIRWDAANDRFVFGFRKPNAPLVSANVPYTLPDNVPPAAPRKHLVARSFAPACSNGASVASVNATFLTVRVNAP